MKKYELNITDESILDSINKDYIQRNSKLNKLIEILNSIEDNRVISIDGNWGTGKTVFVKQLELLNKEEYSNKINSNFNEVVLREYRKKYIVHYYNAWEYDYHSAPLLSILYSILKLHPEIQSNTASGEIELPINIKELLKSISGNFFDLDKVKSYGDLCKEIMSLDEIRIAFNNLIDEIVPRDMRLLLIIDEIDRCKPVYAVELLESIKHIFNNDKIAFIISTNNVELSHVIQNCYGSNFDGYGYLNKFYDLMIELDDINPQTYLEKVIGLMDNGYYINIVLIHLLKHYKLTMRQINRIINDYDLLEDYFMKAYGEFEKDDIIVKYIFLPYCLVLKNIDGDKLQQFLSGNGIENMVKFILTSEEIKNIIARESNLKQGTSDEEIIRIIREKYELFFVKTVLNYDELLKKQTFIDTFSMLGNKIRI